MSQNWTPPLGAPPVNIPNYLVFAILSTIFCCLPAGVVSIIYAAQVNSKIQAGDIPGAMASSKNAKTWAMVAVGAGVLWIILIIVYIVIVGSLGAMSNVR